MYFTMEGYGYSLMIVVVVELSEPEPACLQSRPLMEHSFGSVTGLEVGWASVAERLFRNILLFASAPTWHFRNLWTTQESVGLPPS